MVASITPAWTAATTSSPGCWLTTSRTAPEARATNCDQLSPPGAIGTVGSLSQSGTEKVSTISDHSIPSASPGWSSHRSQRSRTGPSASGPDPTTGRRRLAVSVARGSTEEYRAVARRSSPLS